MAPSSIVTIAITFAAIGRSIKNREISIRAILSGLQPALESWARWLRLAGLPIVRWPRRFEWAAAVVASVEAWAIERLLARLRVLRLFEHRSPLRYLAAAWCRRPS